MECSSTELGYRQNTSYRAKNVVNVLKLVTKDTIEEKIIHLQGKKAKLAEDIIEGKETAAATGMTPSAYIRTMALDGGNVDTTSHEDRQKLMYELSTIGNNINQIARMANTNVFISKSDVQEVNEQLKQIQRLLLQYIRNR